MFTAVYLPLHAPTAPQFYHIDDALFSHYLTLYTLPPSSTLPLSHVDWYSMAQKMGVPMWILQNYYTEQIMSKKQQPSAPPPLLSVSTASTSSHAPSS